jgi:membrane fusion protein (multidrug efflux system)
LIRSGQKMGEFIANDEFELEVNVNVSYKDVLKIGEAVKLTSLTGTTEWGGVVKRINGKIDQNTQTVMVFIGVKGKSLVEGMYMEAKIDVRSEQNAFQVSRNLMINENQLYAVEDNQLILKTVTPVFFTDKTAVVKGLPEGIQLLTKPIPGAYSGMAVKIADSTEK